MHRRPCTSSVLSTIAAPGRAAQQQFRALVAASCQKAARHPRTPFMSCTSDNCRKNVPRNEAGPHRTRITEILSPRGRQGKSKLCPDGRTDRGKCELLFEQFLSETANVRDARGQVHGRADVHALYLPEAFMLTPELSRLFGAKGPIIIIWKRLVDAGSAYDLCSAPTR